MFNVLVEVKITEIVKAGADHVFAAERIVPSPVDHAGLSIVVYHRVLLVELLDHRRKPITSFTPNTGNLFVQVVAVSVLLTDALWMRVDEVFDYVVREVSLFYKSCNDPEEGFAPITLGGPADLVLQLFGKERQCQLRFLILQRTLDRCRMRSRAPSVFGARTTRFTGFSRTIVGQSRRELLERDRRPVERLRDFYELRFFGATLIHLLRFGPIQRPRHAPDVRDVSCPVITAGVSLQSFCDRFRGLRRHWFCEEIKGLKASRARLQHILGRDGQPLRPARRISIVEIGHEPEAGDDVLFSALRSRRKIRSKDRQRHVSVVVGLAGYLAQMPMYRCRVADVEMRDFWGQPHARLPRLRVNSAGVFTESGDDNFAWLLDSASKVTDNRAMAGNPFFIDRHGAPPRRAAAHS